MNTSRGAGQSHHGPVPPSLTADSLGSQTWAHIIPYLAPKWKGKVPRKRGLHRTGKIWYNIGHEIFDPYVWVPNERPRL